MYLWNIVSNYANFCCYSSYPYVEWFVAVVTCHHEFCGSCGCGSPSRILVVALAFILVMFLCFLGKLLLNFFVKTTCGSYMTEKRCKSFPFVHCTSKGSSWLAPMEFLVRSFLLFSLPSEVSMYASWIYVFLSICPHNLINLGWIIIAALLNNYLQEWE